MVQEASRQIPVGNTHVWHRKFSSLTLFLISQRNKFRQKLQRSNNYSERNITISSLKQLTIRINLNVNNDRNNSWYQFIQKLPTGNKKF